MLIAAIKSDLARIGRDVTSQDGLEFFEDEARDSDGATHFTAEGKIMAGRKELVGIDGLENQTIRTLETLWRQLDVLDDDHDSIVSIGRTVLKKIGLEGRDIVDVVAEPYTEITENDQGEEVRTPTFSIFLGTSDGKTFVVTVNELPQE